MSDATKLPPEVQKAAMKEISAEGLPSAIERQAAAGKAESPRAPQRSPFTHTCVHAAAGHTNASCLRQAS